MTINELFKAFTDIEFQANRLMKIKNFDDGHLQQFDIRSEEIRLEVLKLDLSDEMNEEFRNLGRIDCEYSPEIKFGHTLLNILSFGFYKKRYISRKRETYFIGEINHRKKLFLHTKHQLKDT
ncbi:MAG: hypothetical protein FGM14_08720 [Flavobacteriales bacterium]|nr:hypothetical protein [Flavobacteriales bacterium]